jgi:cell wall-associated NlpC family hydrolase
MKLFLQIMIMFGWIMVSCDTVHQPDVIVDTPDQDVMETLIDAAMGKPYAWGAEGPDAFDCSGLVYWIYGSMNVRLARVSKEQAKEGREVPLGHLQYGDLIFFDTEKKFDGIITHVGIYVGDGNMVYASSIEQKVIKRTLAEYPYFDRIVCCRRVAEF